MQTNFNTEYQLHWKAAGHLGGGVGVSPALMAVNLALGLYFPNLYRSF